MFLNERPSLCYYLTCFPQCLNPSSKAGPPAKLPQGVLTRGWPRSNSCGGLKPGSRSPAGARPAAHAAHAAAHTPTLSSAVLGAYRSPPGHSILRPPLRSNKMARLPSEQLLESDGPRGAVTRSWKGRDVRRFLALLGPHSPGLLSLVPGLTRTAIL